MFVERACEGDLPVERTYGCDLSVERACECDFPVKRACGCDLPIERTCGCDLPIEGLVSVTCLLLLATAQLEEEVGERERNYNMHSLLLW